MRHRIFSLASLLLLCVAMVVQWTGAFGRAVFVEYGTCVSYRFACCENGSILVGDVEGAGTPIGLRIGSVYTDDRMYGIHQREHPVVYWSSAAYDSPRHWSIGISLWKVIGALAVLPGCRLLLRLTRHENTNSSGVYCSCSYDLTGNTSGVCPECGTTVESKAVPSSTMRSCIANSV